MNTRIFLNEGTEIGVTQSKEEIKKLISEKESLQRQPYRGLDSHFIEVNVELIVYSNGDSRENFEKSNSMDLYFKRILFIYEL